MLTRHRSRFLRFVACLAVASPIVASPAQAAGVDLHAITSCSAAGCTTPYWGAGQIAAGFGPGGYRPGQTFTAKFTGVLGAVRLGLHTLDSPASDAIAEIRATVNGLPTGAIMAEAPVTGAPYTPGVLHTADFTGQNTLLAAGTRYAVTLRSPSPHHVLAAFPPCPPSTGTNDFCDSWDGGQTWSTSPAGSYPNDRSIIFEICLDAATATRATTWGRVKAIYR